MTEEEWLAATDPEPMLEFLQGKVSDRKVQLFACASCRRLTAILTDEKCWANVALAEMLADDSLKAEDRYSRESVWEDFYESHGAICQLPDDNERAQAHAATAANIFQLVRFRSRVAHEATLAIGYRARFHHPVKGYPMNRDGGDPVLRQAIEDEERLQTSLLRDIIGPLPFRSMSFSAEWRTSTVELLTKQMYESRDFSAMPILADALQDAGCENEEILNHCRDEKQVHVRGCFVVDLLLGKE